MLAYWHTARSRFVQSGAGADIEPLAYRSGGSDSDQFPVQVRRTVRNHQEGSSINVSRLQSVVGQVDRELSSVAVTQYAVVDGTGNSLQIGVGKLMRLEGTVSVETLCIVLDQKVFLCSIDNQVQLPVPKISHGIGRSGRVIVTDQGDPSSFVTKHFLQHGFGQLMEGTLVGQAVQIPNDVICTADSVNGSGRKE